MPAAITLSVVFGVIWDFIAVWLMGGKSADAFKLSWLAAGMIAGALSGWFTIWSRERRDGDESIQAGLAGYGLAIVGYWLVFVILERLSLCVRHGGWTDFNLRDHLMLIGPFLILGTLWYGIILIPLSFLCRWIVWVTYQRFAIARGR
jgi:hypothetical protein